MNEKVTDIVFYTIEKSIKSYRKFAQRRIDKANFDITIDQWLVLRFLDQHPGISQRELAEAVFKDVASVTRIIDLLVKKEYLARAFHQTDRRRFELSITEKGHTIVADIQSIVYENRSIALDGISEEKIEDLQTTLRTIISNCN